MSKKPTTLIVGLGNPGRKYEFTRHNVGFRVMQRLREELGLPQFEKEVPLYSERTSGTVDGQEIVLGRSLTYMNDSGHAVEKLKSAHKVHPRRVWIIHDDKDLELGDMRVKQGGSAAGHHGVESVEEMLKTKNFTRYRLGVMTPAGKKIPAEKFVIGKFLPEEEPAVRNMVDRAAQQLIEDLEIQL